MYSGWSNRVVASLTQVLDPHGPQVLSGAAGGPAGATQPSEGGRGDLLLWLEQREELWRELLPAATPPGQHPDRLSKVRPVP